MRRNRPQALARFYADAKQLVIAAGFADELTWQANRDPAVISESTFLREAAWVILNSGFREAVVRRHFGYISLCFCDWESAETILSCADVCVETASAAFRNPTKMRAIVNVCSVVHATTFSRFGDALASDPIETIQALHYFGPATAYHLAKNLGFQLAKPDRHLVRLAQRFGTRDVQQFCADVALVAGDAINVVDITLWRYSVLVGAGAGTALGTAHHV